MANKRTTAIFFDDLKDEAQQRIIGEELQTALQMSKEPVIRSFRIDPNLYGYDPDPAKQTLEQHITVLLVDGDRRTTHPWLMVWDCMEAEFTTFMQTDQEPPKIEGQIGKAISSRSVDVYLPKENNQ